MKIIPIWVWTVAFVLLLAGTAGATWVTTTRANDAACNLKVQSVKDSTDVARVDAEKAGRKAQADYDAIEINRLKGYLDLQWQAAIEAQKTASEAQAKAAQLASDLKRLRAHDPSIETWDTRCLPDAVLASMHGDQAKAAGSRCRRAGSGDQARVP